MSSPALQFDEVAFSYPGIRVFDRLRLTVEEGEFLAVLGPNGCGKTTLARLAGRMIVPDRGRVRVGGEDVGSLSTSEIARRLALVPQEEPSLFSFSVEEVVLMGRTPWLSGFGFEAREDREVAAECLRAVMAEDFTNRDLAELSGGERQRVLVARALAQKAPLLILDEPTSHLDLRHRVGILRLLGRLRESEGLTVVVISHDVNLASRFVDRLVLLADGAVEADGAPRDVLRPEILSKVYGTSVSVRAVSGMDVPHVFPE